MALKNKRKSQTVRIMDQGLSGLARFRMRDMEAARTELVDAGMLKFWEARFGYTYELLIPMKKCLEPSDANYVDIVAAQ
jgi:hypothetical protein